MEDGKVIIREEKISLKTAKLAKEKKFDAIVKGSITEYLNTKIDKEYPEGGGHGWKKGDLEGDDGYFRNFDAGADYSNKNYIMYARPTQAVLARWLREIHNYHIEIHQIPIHPTYNFAIIWVFNGVQCKTGDGYKSYEEALEAGLIETLNLIKV